MKANLRLETCFEASKRVSGHLTCFWKVILGVEKGNPSPRILSRVNMRHFRPLQKSGGNLEEENKESATTDFVHSHGFCKMGKKNRLERRFEVLKWKFSYMIILLAENIGVRARSSRHEN